MGNFRYPFGLLRLCIYQFLGSNEYDPLSRAIRGAESGFLGGGRDFPQSQAAWHDFPSGLN